MGVTWTRLPFHFKTTADYEAKLSAYISSVFYDRLPAAGFEVREEQIYTAFRIARALAKGQKLLAEAGLGTGKTFAYLIPAICHARLKGTPVVISSASTVLQEQLANPNGDVAALSRLLDLRVDTRVAKDPTQHLCELKLEAARPEAEREGLSELIRWAEASEHGERSEVPDAPDEAWERVAWDPGLNCDTCKRRGFCRLTRAREHYRKAADLIVCDHRLFFHDLWTRRERREAGLQPLLPTYSAVVFDEGHDMPEAAQEAAGFRMDLRALATTIAQSGEYNDRPGLLRAVRAGAQAARAFSETVSACVIPAEADKLHLRRENGQLTEAAEKLATAVEKLQDELATEEAMFEDTAWMIQVVAFQARLDYLSAGLRLLRRPPSESVAWFSRGETPALWVVPRQVAAVFQRELYSQNIPIVWSSATLASGDSFDYMKRAVGAPDAAHAQVGVPFDLAKQALVYRAPSGAEPLVQLEAVLRAAEGRALILVNSLEEAERLRPALTAMKLPWQLLWEGEAERAELLRRFKADIHSILIGSSYWEGVDVPGEALSCVAVLHLPFPPHDPLVTARREDAGEDGLDPFLAVDVPAMAMKLKQGRGRLIRTSSDRGAFALLDRSYVGTDYEDAVEDAFPEDAEVTEDLDVVRRFLS